MFEKKRKKKVGTLNAILLIGVLLVAGVLAVLQRIQPDEEVQIHPDVANVILNEETCTISGGEWNACGSACRSEPDVPCIEVCVEYCECVSDADCPFAHTCQDPVDGRGVCLPG